MCVYTSPRFRNGLAGFLFLVGTSSSPALLAQDEKNAGDRVVVSPVKGETGDETLATTGAPAAGEVYERAVGASGRSLPVPQRQFGMDRPSPKHTLFGPTIKTLRALPNPKLATGGVPAPYLSVPIPDGSYSVWSTAWGLNPDGSRNGVSSWGFNAFAGVTLVDPLRPGMVLEFENNYQNPLGEKQTEAYIELVNVDNSYVRPFQIEIPLAGARMNNIFMFTSTDAFSFMNRENTSQQLKIYDLGVAIARNMPFFFTNTNDCAGCKVEVGLQPYGPQELAVVTDLSFRLGNFRAAAVSATSLSGDGSAITGVNASNIRNGILQDAILSSNVALKDRGNVFLTTQFFDATGFSGMPGIAIRGSAANPFPNLSISSAALPAGHNWEIVARGDNGALTVSNETAVGGLAIDTVGNVWAAKDLVVQGKVRVQEGANGSVGQADLLGGIKTVTSNAVRSTSRIFLTHAGAVGTVGHLYVGTIVDGVSFEIRSSSSTDASPVNYWIVN